MSFKLDTSKFKKIKADKHSTTMRHEDGHELTIAHKALSPKMRGQLIAMPAAEPQKLAMGGEAEDETEMSKKKPPSDDHDKKVSEGLTVDPKNPKVKSLGVIFKANGGEVDPTQQHLTQGDKLPNSIEKEVVGDARRRVPHYADGGPEQDSPDKIAADAAAQAAPQEQPAAPQQQAPVVVNVQAPQAAPQQPPADESIMHKLGAGAGWMLHHTPPALAMDLAKTAGPTVKEGVQDAIAGASGIPSQELNAKMGALDAPAAPAAPQPSQMMPAAPGAAPGMQDPYGANTAFGVYQQGITQGKQGIQEAAQAAQSLSADQVKAADAQAAQQQTLQAEYQTHSRDILDKSQAALQALNEGHINPNHYMESLGAGKKVMTAIGLILGGIGGGSSGKNAALDFLNSQIDRDINAQKAELGKKETVYSGFLKQFQNEKDATDMSRIFQNQAYALQLQKAAAANASPAAQAAAHQALSALNMNTAQLQGQLAMRKTLLSGVNQGQIQPEMLLRAGVVSDKDHAAFAKELGEAQELAKARDMTLNALQEVAKINTLGHRISSPMQTPSRINALKQPVVAALSKATAGRFTEQDAHMLDTLFSSMTDNAETNALKLRQADKLISEKAVYPTLKAYNVDTSKFGRYGAPTGAAPQKRIQLGPPVR